MARVGDAGQAPDMVAAGGRRTVRTALPRRAALDAGPAAGRRRAADKGLAGDPMAERIDRAPITATPAGTSLGRPTVPTIETVRLGPTTAIAHLPPITAIAHLPPVTAIARHGRTTAIARHGRTTAARATRASRLAHGARTSTAAPGSATGRIRRDRPGPGSSLLHRSSHSERTRSSSPDDVLSRRRSSPAAMPTACSSSRSDAMRSSSSCCTPPACGFPSRRSRADR